MTTLNEYLEAEEHDSLRYLRGAKGLRLTSAEERNLQSDPAVPCAEKHTSLLKLIYDAEEAHRAAWKARNRALPAWHEHQIGG